MSGGKEVWETRGRGQISDSHRPYAGNTWTENEKGSDTF
jgi:hypothetical protein